jgi:uncharacterized damage-inducible protein DinB
MTALELLRIRARANRLVNRRLHAALEALAPGEFEAPRVGYFPSLAGTLSHILAVDTYYLAALHREPDMVRQWEEFVPPPGLAELALRQRASDERLIRFVERLDEAGVNAEIVLDRGETRAPERVAHVLQHLDMHQTHHRGQAHAMLAGTSVRPPQLDEFLMPSDAPTRVADLVALGWTERTVFPA